nr:RecName: Full=Antifungal lectin PVAP [Phaseolus vulgaris]
SNDIYFNFQR